MIKQNLVNKILEPNDSLIIVDAGARGGTKEVESLHSISSIYAFEPNPDEVEKIDVTGAGKNNTSLNPKRGQVSIWPYALAGKTGTSVLNVSRRPGASSLLEPDAESLSHFKKDNWSELVEVVERLDVPSTTVADFAESTGLDYIDLFKLDTQGTELEILESAGALLERVSIIRAEVEFMTMYKGQPLFHHMADVLFKLGFELIDIQHSQSCKRFQYDPYLPPEAYRLIWGDAVFVHRPYDFNAPRAIQKALVLGAMGYVDPALYILSNLPSLDDRTAKELELFLRDTLKPPTWKSKVRRFVEKNLGLEISRYNWHVGKQIISRRT